MKIPHNKFCVLPWVSIETSPVGTVRPCCLAEDELCDNSGNKFQLTNAKFYDIQNSNQLQTLRQEFLNGKQPTTCKKCWKEEDAGRRSKRMNTLARLKNMLSDETWTLDAKPLMFLDLKLGNICNLKCRICGSWSSSTYATEEVMEFPVTERKTSFPYTMLQKGAWPKNNTAFWGELSKIVNQVQYIEFTGGEPFMITEHFEMLQHLVNTGVAKNIEIHYNTNGTHYPDHAEQIWKHFKLVEIAFSIDDVQERFEYQRANASWDAVTSNINKFLKLRSNNSNIKLQVCCTINVFNVFHLDVVATWLDSWKFDFVYWNMLHEAYYFSIASLPVEAKSRIEEKLNNSSRFVNDAVKQEFKQIIQFMNNGTSLDGTMLHKQIRDVDIRRGQNLADVDPVLANMINYDKNKI